MSLLVEILRDSNYGLSLFSDKELQELERKITEKKSKGKKQYFINCIIREKEIQLKPEEVVRQLYTNRLVKKYGYPKSKIAFEHAIHFGREVKSADIVVFDKDRPNVEYIILEVKKPKLKTEKASFVHILTLLVRQLLFGQMEVKFPITTEKIQTSSKKSPIFLNQIKLLKIYSRSASRGEI